MYEYYVQYYIVVRGTVHVRTCMYVYVPYVQYIQLVTYVIIVSMIIKNNNI